MAAKKKSKRKIGARRGRSAARRHSHEEIPLTVLKARLARLSRVVKTRESRRQTSMF